MLSHRPTQSSYDTSNVRVEDRISYWHDVICKVHVPAAGKALETNVFNASLTATDLGPVELTEMRSSRQFWRRAHSHIRETDEDVFLLSYAASGTCRFEQGHKQVVQNRGEFLLYDTAVPFTYELDPEVFYVLKIRRQALLARCPDISRALAMPLGERLPLSATLLTLLREASRYSSPSDPADLRSRLGHALLDVLALAVDLNLGSDQQSGDRYELLFQKLQRYLASNLDDTELSIEKLARKHHLSARSVTRLFARHGVTPMGWLREKRLEASYQALSSGSKMTVTQAALQFGFADLSHFSRTFKSRFGTTPHDVSRKLERH